MALIPAYGHNDALPNSHPLYVGIPGGRGAPEAAEAIHRADVMLALGSRLSQGSTSWDYGIDQSARRRSSRSTSMPRKSAATIPVEVGIVGDAKAVATQLLEALLARRPRTAANNGVARRDRGAEGEAAGAAQGGSWS